MKISQLLVAVPLVVQSVKNVFSDTPRTATDEELIGQMLCDVCDTLQNQENEAEHLRRAEMLARVAVTLLQGHYNVTPDQARAAVDTADLILDRAIEITGRK